MERLAKMYATTLAVLELTMPLANAAKAESKHAISSTTPFMANIIKQHSFTQDPVIHLSKKEIFSSATPKDNASDKTAGSAGSLRRKLIPGLLGGEITNKVIGGDRAGPNTYKWFTSLYNRDAGIVFCGASLISSEFVLTAAHCQPDTNDLVIIGAVCLEDSNNCGQTFEVLEIKKVFAHPDYTTDFWHGVVSNDFALIQLNEPSDIAPVKIDNGEYSPSYATGKSLWGMGFGIFDVENVAQPDQLLHVELEYVEQEECKGRLLNNFLGPATMCAYYEKRDVCRGDSGGPLLDRENGDIVVGVVSYGEICDGTPDFPGVYGRVSDGFNWIKNTICSVTQHDEICSTTKSPTISPAPTIAPAPCTGLELDLSINTDSSSEETIYFVNEMVTNYIQGFGGSFIDTFEDNTDYAANVCLPQRNNSECYHFYIGDSGGNGISNYDGSSNGYCAIVDGEEVSCDYDWNGVQVSAFFPIEACDECNPVELSIDISMSSIFGDNFFIVIDGENAVVPFATIDGSSFEFGNQGQVGLTYLCKNGCYTIEALNLGFGTSFDLYLDGNLVATERDVRSGKKSFCGDGSSAFRRSVLSLASLTALAVFGLLL